MDNRRSFRTTDFKKQIQKLPSTVQKDALAAFGRWRISQAMVEFKPLDCAGGEVWSARIGYRNRALASELTLADGTVCWMWFWAGTREDYETTIKSSKLKAAHRNAVETYQKKLSCRSSIAKLH